ncbi:MAG: TlpA family protein disulfide reductase [Alphaproteobacteria bacterium]
MPHFRFAIHTWFFNILASALLLSFPAFSQTAPLEQHNPPKPLPRLDYADVSGTIHTLKPDTSSLAILHLWATWCVPCIEELPILDSVANAYKDKGVAVITLSLDGKNARKVTDFYTTHNIRTLPAYFDYQMKAFRALKFKGLPATVFIKNGREIARIDGPADWKSAEVKALLDIK